MYNMVCNILNWARIINKSNQWSTHASAHMQQWEKMVVVPRIDAALPLWTATNNLWKRYLNKFSLMVSLRRLPRSLKNRRFSEPQAPDGSIAMEVNE